MLNVVNTLIYHQVIYYLFIQYNHFHFYLYLNHIEPIYSIYFMLNQHTVFCYYMQISSILFIQNTECFHNNFICIFYIIYPFNINSYLCYKSHSNVLPIHSSPKTFIFVWSPNAFIVGSFVESDDGWYVALTDGLNDG